MFLSTSCGTTKGLQYVVGPFDTASLSKIEFKEPTIQKGDMLSIRVLSDDPVATAAVISELPPTQGVDAPEIASANPANNFLVDQSGNLSLYKLGTIHVEKMTKKQLSDTMALMYEQKGLLKNPYVEIRFLNYKVTLVGEVARPGVYTIPVEKVNVFEAVGLAGDITFFGRRDNVLVVRETNGVREFGRLDLSKPEVFNSPFFYLHQNDMVIVDVKKNKSSLNDQTTVRNLTLAVSVLSAIAIFVNVFSN